MVSNAVLEENSGVLFDRNLLKKNKERAIKNFSQSDFLFHEIAEKMAENVKFLNRNFDDILEISPRDKFLYQLLSQDFIQNNCNYEFCADEEFLTQNSKPNQSEKYDLILSNLNLHYVNDVPQFLLSVKNSLKKGGVFMASFFGEENLSELAHTLYKTENEIYGGVSPRMPPTIDVKTAAHLLQKAGFENPTSDFDKIHVEYSSPLKLLQDLKNMGQGNVLTKRSRRFMTKGFLEKIVTNYEKLYPQKTATFEVVTITGWKAK